MVRTFPEEHPGRRRMRKDVTTDRLQRSASNERHGRAGVSCALISEKNALATEDRTDIGLG